MNDKSCSKWNNNKKDPSIISDAKILIGHLNLMTLTRGFLFYSQKYLPANILAIS